ncbi:hypothetical protein Tco_0087404 [Tanacetum coccineum]
MMRKWKLTNYILLYIPNEIYNSVDSCKTAKEMWDRVERLMRGTIQNQVDRETRFINEFDQFVAEPGESLVSVYNRFAQLMNDLERNNMKFPTVSLLIMMKSMSRMMFTTILKIPMGIAMLLLAKAITQNFSNPTNNRLRASSNTRNQAVVQGDRVNIQSRRNSEGNVEDNYRRLCQESCLGMNATMGDCKCSNDCSKSDTPGILSRVNNDFLFADASRMEEIEELSANICLMARIQPADQNSDDEPSYESAFVSEVQSSSINENVNELLTRYIVHDLCALKTLARNANAEAAKQQILLKRSHNKI